ncbi:unnamed protein product [Arctogadus glacialis]
MEELAVWFYNHTGTFQRNFQRNTLNTTLCQNTLYSTLVTMSDLFSVLVGTPLIAKLLWTAFHSKKTDVLNINLAIFHYLQYLLSLVDLCLVFYNVLKHLQMVRFLSVYVLIGGPMNLSFICLERYIAVIHPTFYPLLKKYRCREVCALSVWLLAVPPSLIKVLYAERDMYAAIDTVAYIVFGLLVITMVWSNVAILKALRTSGPVTDQLHPAKKRAFQTVGAISTLTLLCYIPVVILSNYRSIKRDESACLMVPATIFLVSVASMVHPIFYLAATGNLFSCPRPIK